ncbi:FecCD family ABC transporter permease [Skermania piniformis]|uniref:Iron chelate uptake ABC transporter family permease subunit n=1 Tax=Skermania pinensis TaxID=39122 RepID=A0ABX8SBK5_9ACTN|nr:iron chelate uptake ABC transporter family permease subunit [Skermania piniformis]QXQ13830.1 iron chelate uptake ABC transporter family permease subunit [Skermania piniformis]
MNAGNIDFGRRVAVVALPVAGPVRIGLRPVAVGAVLVIAALAVSILALSTGDYLVPPQEVIQALLGRGPRVTNTVVVQWRLPRVVLGLVVGAALGMAGAIVQSLTRNPLGSPDVIGFDVGAYTGVLVTITWFGSDYYRTAAGALIGGLLTALVVYLFATRYGFQGFRLIVSGIAIAAMLASVNQWLIIKSDLHTAMSAAIWQTGSLNGADWAAVLPAGITLLLLGAVVVALGSRLTLLDLGDDAASALGLQVSRVQSAYLVIGVAFTALATAVAGPVSFVALAAPQLARRLAGSAGVAMGTSAAMGAFLVVGCDWLGQRLFAPNPLPVGVVTVSVGGAYFAWLLARQGRS